MSNVYGEGLRSPEVSQLTDELSRAEIPGGYATGFDLAEANLGQERGAEDPVLMEYVLRKTGLGSVAEEEIVFPGGVTRSVSETIGGETVVRTMRVKDYYLLARNPRHGDAWTYILDLAALDEGDEADREEFLDRRRTFWGMVNAYTKLDLLGGQ